jgi:hypothetical protein
MASTASKERLGPGISRRVWLQAGTAIAAIGLAPGWASGREALASPELFVFRAPNSANTVIGLTIPFAQGRFSTTTARIHVGAKTWSADPARPARARFANDDRVRIFAGRCVIGARFVEAVVLELDARELAPAETFDVWAEISRGEEPRRRLGNPIVAELVRCNRELAQIHRRISPIDDRAILTPLVTQIVAARARKVRIASHPDAYARRLTDAILPDVIRFTPTSPLGFSYAGQNGRHPAERTSEIVRTLLGGSLVPVADERGTVLLDRFPYLISTTDLS